MTFTMNKGVLLAAAAAALTGLAASAAAQDAAAPAAPASTIASAESAGPASISSHATIMGMGANGAMTVLRKGSNAWTCTPDDPSTPGPDPMCFDANAGKWIDAMMHKQPAPEGAVGIMYMLQGGMDPSNTDPAAAAPKTADGWIKTGPHLMIVGSKELLAAYPGGAKPDTSAPYVMFAGTPSAHLMVPVGH